MKNFKFSWLHGLILLLALITGHLRAAVELTDDTTTGIQTATSPGYRYQVTAAGTFGTGGSGPAKIYAFNWQPAAQEWVQVPGWELTDTVRQKTLTCTGDKLQFQVFSPDNTTALSIEALRLPLTSGGTVDAESVAEAIAEDPAAIREAATVQGIREVPVMTKASWSRYTNSSSGILSMTSRRRVVAICAAKDLKLVFQNSSGESNGYSDITVKAAVEDDAGNIFPVTFSGSRTATVSATGALTTSDPVSGLTTVKGRSYFLRTFSSWASGNVYLNGVVDNSTQTGEGRIDSVDRADSGVITATTNYAFVPNMVLGTPIAHNPYETYVFLGDSNMDLLNQGGFQSWEDNWTVSSLGTDHGRNFPYIRLSLGGSQVQIVNSGASTRRRQFFTYGSIFVILLGTNDVRAHPTTPTSGATVLANLQSLARELLTGGAKEVWVCTLPPDTSASNQNAIRVALNDLLRAEPNPFRGVIDLADAMETSRNSNTWISGYNQADNYHLSNTGGAVARQLIRDTLLKSR